MNNYDNSQTPVDSYNNQNSKISAYILNTGNRPDGKRSGKYKCYERWAPSVSCGNFYAACEYGYAYNDATLAYDSVAKDLADTKDLRFSLAYGQQGCHQFNATIGLNGIDVECSSMSSFVITTSESCNIATKNNANDWNNLCPEFTREKCTYPVVPKVFVTDVQSHSQNLCLLQAF